MKLKDKHASERPRLGRLPSRGFSTVEVLVTLALILVLGAIASPMLIRTVRIYQLNDGATQLAGMLKLTRFEAISKNTKVDCRFQASGARWTMWKDSNLNGTPDATETQLVLGGYADLLAAAAVPDPAAITASLG